MKMYQLKASVFYNLYEYTTKLRKLRHLSNSYEQNEIVKTKKQHLKQWRYMFKKTRALQECEVVHNTLGIQKTKAKYLALWFQSLHIKLKLAHMTKLQTKFTKQTLGKRYLKTWMTECKKQKKISIKTDEIQRV